MPRMTQQEFDEYRARMQGKDLQAEAARQQRQAAKRDDPIETIIQQKGVAMARQAMAIAGINPLLLKATPNGADVAEIARQRLYCEGMVPGWPDLDLMWPKWILDGEVPLLYPFSCCEVKRPGEKLRKEQQEIRAMLLKVGAHYVIAYTPEEIRDWVIDYLGIDGRVTKSANST